MGRFMYNPNNSLFSFPSNSFLSINILHQCCSNPLLLNVMISASFQRLANLLEDAMHLKMSDGRRKLRHNE